MAEKISKRRAQELIDELHELKKKQAQLVATRDTELATPKAEYEAACAPINERYNKRLTGFATDIASKEKDLREFMLTGFDEQTGAVALGMLESAVVKGKQLVAVVKVGSTRVVPPEGFFKAVAERTSEFWGCLTVGLAKAEKFIGAKRVEDLAHKKYTASVSFESREIAKATAAKAKAATAE
jgi:hypothetical protein